MSQILLLMFGFLWAQESFALGDSQREADLTESLRQRIAIGRAVDLNADGAPFLGLYTESEKTDNRLAVIILHDVDGHLDYKPLVHELRTSLPARNIATLSILLPLREAGADINDYFPLFEHGSHRVAAAIDYLKQQGSQQIALIGYGLGAQIAIFHLGAHPEQLAALVAISLPILADAPPEGKTDELIPRVALPFLDVYAEYDLPSVLDTARQRRMLGKDNPVFRQLKIDGENHSYEGDAALVVKRIYSWLATTFDVNKP